MRRDFIYIGHSIEEGTQWAVFEPNRRRRDGFDAVTRRGVRLGSTNNSGVCSCQGCLTVAVRIP